MPEEIFSRALCCPPTELSSCFRLYLVPSRGAFYRRARGGQLHPRYVHGFGHSTTNSGFIPTKLTTLKRVPKKSFYESTNCVIKSYLFLF